MHIGRARVELHNPNTRDVSHNFCIAVNLCTLSNLPKAYWTIEQQDKTKKQLFIAAKAGI